MGLRDAKKLRTRQEIADQAMKLFAQRGFDGVTVAEVATAADVSEKTVYNYFPTKEDLFFAARKQALAGKHGPSATRRLRADLDRAYHLLEHGLSELERPARDLNATHTA